MILGDGAQTDPRYNLALESGNYFDIVIPAPDVTDGVDRRLIILDNANHDKFKNLLNFVSEHGRLVGSFKSADSISVPFNYYSVPSSVRPLEPELFEGDSSQVTLGPDYWSTEIGEIMGIVDAYSHKSDDYLSISASGLRKSLALNDFLDTDEHPITLTPIVTEHLKHIEAFDNKNLSNLCAAQEAVGDDTLLRNLVYVAYKEAFQEIVSS